MQFVNAKEKYKFNTLILYVKYRWHLEVVKLPPKNNLTLHDEWKYDDADQWSK